MNKPHLYPGLTEEDIKAMHIGGMALGNGIAFYTRNNWSVAVRKPDGTIVVDSGPRHDLTGNGTALQKRSVVRPVARLIGIAQSFSFLPFIKSRVPEARLPFSIGSVAASFAIAGAASWIARRPRLGLSKFNQELLSSVFALLPALITTRGSSAARYHGAEHKAVAALSSLGSEGATARGLSGSAKEHPRCGTNLAGILVVTSTVSNWALSILGKRVNPGARAVAGIASMALATELFSWATRNPDKGLARAIIRPGIEIQRFLTTREPDVKETEVSLASLDALLAREAISRS